MLRTTQPNLLLCDLCVSAVNPDFPELEMAPIGSDPKQFPTLLGGLGVLAPWRETRSASFRKLAIEPNLVCRYGDRRRYWRCRPRETA